MPTNKIPVTAYLDETEDKKLKATAKEWGCSLSAAIKRLIREQTLKNELKTVLPKKERSN